MMIIALLIILVSLVILAKCKISSERSIIVDIEQTYKDYIDGLVTKQAATKRIINLTNKLSMKFFREVSQGFINLINRND